MFGMKKIVEKIYSRTIQFEKEIDATLEAIKKYDRIVVFRHQKPDYDAIGSQLGLVYFLKDNFPKKEVHYVGDDHVSLTGRCFPKMEVLDDAWFEKPFLGIVLDCSVKDRIADERFAKAETLIKIDHHPNVDPYGDIMIVDTSMAAAGELLANILLSFDGDYKIGKESATNLYKAIVGDSGRFLYESTTVHTFRICEILLATGLDLSQVYLEMYNKSLSDLEVQAYILRHYHVTKNGIAYYVLNDETLKRFNLPPERGKDNVNIFAHFDGIHAWLSVTEDVSKGEWRVSIRSEHESIQDIAEKYNGGGHDQASGAKLKSLDELDSLLKDLDEKFQS